MRTCCEALQSRKAFDITTLRVADVSSVTDHFVIASGFSRPQVQALADAVVDAMQNIGCRALRSEGYTEARWVCLDYGDLVVHIFHDEVRRYFDLERLWGDAPRARFPGAAAQAAPA